MNMEYYQPRYGDLLYHEVYNEVLLVIDFYIAYNVYNIHYVTCMNGVIERDYILDNLRLYAQLIGTFRDDEI